MDSDNKLTKQITKGIVEFLRKIKKEYLINSIIELLQKEKDLKRAIIYAPTSLKAIEKKNIINAVSKLIGEKVENVDFRLDESLIDGLKIIYDDKLWDFSLSSQIKDLIKN